MKNNFTLIASSAKFIRLQRNLTQEIAASESGISLRTLQNIEAGKSVNSSSLFAYLNYLGLLNNMLATLPDPTQLSPMELINNAPHRRARAGRSIKKTATSIREANDKQNVINEKVIFQWGDEK